MNIRNLTLLTAACTFAFCTAVSAASLNTAMRTRNVHSGETMQDIDLKIEPHDEVETGSSIILTFTNAHIPTQNVIDGVGPDTDIGYRDGGYQYPYCDWDDSEGFYDVMPKLTVSQLPYRIEKRSENEIEVYLINLPEQYAGDDLDKVNGSSGVPYYRIGLPLIADGNGEVTVKIDGNNTSVSEGVISLGSVYDNSNKHEAQADTASESSSDNSVKTSKTEPKITVCVQIGSTNILVDGKPIDIGSAPYIQPESSSTLVPLRAVSVALSGGNAEDADSSDIVLWDAEAKCVTINADRRTIQFTADSPNIIIDGGEDIPMANGVRAEIKDGRMCVPFRALAEALGAEVEWDAETKTAAFIK